MYLFEAIFQSFLYKAVECEGFPNLFKIPAVSILKKWLDTQCLNSSVLEQYLVTLLNAVSSIQDVAQVVQIQRVCAFPMKFYEPITSGKNFQGRFAVDRLIKTNIFWEKQNKTSNNLTCFFSCHHLD